jgi:predicted ester cyclase
MTAYADGDVELFLSTVTPDWRVHERDGSVSTREDLARITASHREAFPEKEVTFLHEVAEPDVVAHHMRFVLVHSGDYLGIAPTGRRVEFREMIFHRFSGSLIAESWRMTYPDGVYEALAPAPGSDQDESSRGAPDESDQSG